MKRQISINRWVDQIGIFPWPRVMVILAVLGLSALAFPLLGISRSLVLLMAGLAGGAFALMALRSMKYALTVVLLTSATTGLEIGSGRATPIPAGLVMVALLTALWLAHMALVDRRIRLSASPLNAPLLAFLVSALLSWVIGYVVWDFRLVVEKNLLIVQAGQYAVFLFSFATMFLVAHQRLDLPALRLWLVIVVAIGLAEMAAEIFLGLYRGRQMGITGSLLIFPMVLLAAQVLFNPRLKFSWKVFAVLAGLFWCYWAYQNQVWKGGWAPVLIGLAVLAFFYSPRLAALGALGLAALVALNWDWLSAALLSPEVETTSTIRPFIWRDIANMVLPRSPLFGLGLANYMYYWNLPGLIPLSRIAAGWDRWNNWGYAIPSHNMFMDIFAQTGLLGLLLFLWGMAALLWVMYRVSRRLKPGFLRAYVLGVLAGFVAMLIGSFWFADWLIPFAYNITITGFRHSVYTWILLGSVLGLYYRLQAGETLDDA